MALQEDLTDELPSWAFEEGVLGGFEDFMDVNIDSDVLHGLEVETQNDMASENDPEVSRSIPLHASEEISAGKPPSGPSRSSTGVLRRQHKNREAQQRFRERQRVGASSAVDFAALQCNLDFR